MDTIILPRRYHGNYRTISDLLVLEGLTVEHFLIGSTLPEKEDSHFLLAATHIMTPDWIFRQQYDGRYPSGWSKRGSEDPLFPALEYKFLESDQRLIVPPSPEECAQGFNIYPGFMEVITGVIEDIWSLDLGTITIHNHPQITYSSLGRESQESLQVLYDLSDRSGTFQEFVEAHLRAIQRTPSETDLAITRQLSDRGIGLIAIGGDKPMQPETLGPCQRPNPDPNDYVGFKVLDRGYETVLVRV